MNKTKIDYLDYTWNPTAGCKGLGCAVAKNCWAHKMAKRLGRYCEVCPSFAPHVHFNRFDEPLKIKKPSVIGVSFMGEFYSEGISNWVRMEIYGKMEETPQHDYVVLTKQPQNIDGYLPPNLCVGVSVNKQTDLWRISTLKHTCASVKAVSFEPLYEFIEPNLDGIDWVIIGGQTRPKVLPDSLWVDNLTAIAIAYNASVFLKNNLGFKDPIQEFPEGIKK